MGQETLSRFFIFHVMIFPLIVTFFIIIHLIAFRQFGSVGPWHQNKGNRSEKFWPVQIYKDMVVIALLIVLLVGLTAFWRAPVTGNADPIGRSYEPKPVWNFLFLYQALKMFKGRWEFLGTTGIPLAIVLILVLLPFYDYKSQRNPLHRPIAMTAGTGFVVLIIVLTVIGYLSKPGGKIVQSTKGASSMSRNSSDSNSVGAEPEGLKTSVSQASYSSIIQAGRQVYDQHGCSACHMINGQGGKIGPDLSDEANKGHSTDWIIAQIRNPKSHDTKSIMPPFTSLTQEEIRSLAGYLLSLHSNPNKTAEKSGRKNSNLNLPASGKQGPPGEAAMLIGNRNLGRILFDNYCVSCHGSMGKGNVPNPGSTDGKVPLLNPIDPNLSNSIPSVFAGNIDRFIQHGSLPDGPRPSIYMPAFGDDKSLTQPQIAAVESYILQLNSIDRAKIINPGMRPSYFFIMTFLIVSVTFTVVITISHKQKSKAP